MRVPLVVSLAIAVPACGATVGQEPHPLKPVGKASAPITLVRNGRPHYRIVIPRQASSEERKAAEDLQHWVREMTGAELRISTSRPAGAFVRIAADPKLPREAYRIGLSGNNLLLSGSPGRGVINAVYALLEEDLGGRWYTNDSIRLPRTKTLAFAVVPRTYAPKLILRDPFYFASFDPVWSLRNRTNAPDAKVPEEYGGRVDYGGLFVHTHAALLPPDTYFKEHPDYFALSAAGQRHTAQICPTHPDVVRIVTENVLKRLKEQPDTEIVSVSKNDNMDVCHCERCKELREAEGGTDMANQLFLVNQVAEAVEKEYPHVWVDTLAYLETIQVPKTMRPRKNVIIRLCNDVVGAWSRPFTPARQSPVAEVIQQWSAAHDRLSIWDYNVNFSHYLAPMPNMEVIADNIRFWVENHAIGVMTQGGYQSTSERDEMRSWVIAKLMWDPSRDQQALVDDFIAGHYGKAAPMIAEYDRLLVEAGKKHAKELAEPPGGIRYPMTVGFLSKEFLESATAIFARAKEAAAGDETLLRRVERAELPILYVKLAQGPVTEELLTRFETVARREKVDWLLEWQVRLDQQLEAWRKQLPSQAAPTQ